MFSRNAQPIETKKHHPLTKGSKIIVDWEPLKGSFEFYLDRFFIGEIPYLEMQTFKTNLQSTETQSTITQAKKFHPVISFSTFVKVRILNNPKVDK
jgi:hypothetical protein